MAQAKLRADQLFTFSVAIEHYDACNRILLRGRDDFASRSTKKLAIFQYRNAANRQHAMELCAAYQPQKSGAPD